MDASDDSDFFDGQLVAKPNVFSSTIARVADVFPSDPTPLIVTVPPPMLLREISHIVNKAIFTRNVYDNYMRLKYGRVQHQRPIDRRIVRTWMLYAAQGLDSYNITPTDWCVFSFYVWHDFIGKPASQQMPLSWVFDLDRIRKNRHWCRTETRLYAQRLVLSANAAHYVMGYRAVYKKVCEGDAVGARSAIGAFFPRGWKRVYDRALAEAEASRADMETKRQAGFFLWE